MKLNQLPASPAGRIEAKRKGQGMASGNGKTAGRGQKGQKSRSGGYHKVGFEGGQMPLQRRLPKRGFTNPFRKTYALLKVGDLEIFSGETDIKLANLIEKKLVGSLKDGIKLLADGDLTKAVVIHVDKASQSARSKVEAAGGKVIINGEAS